jgi:hypothetical protein
MGSQLHEIDPRTRELVYDLVRATGLDVTDWGNYKRGPAPRVLRVSCRAHPPYPAASVAAAR